MFAWIGPPATKRGLVQDGYTVLQVVLGWLLNVCVSATNCDVLGQQPSTSTDGRWLTTFWCSGILDWSALIAVTHMFNRAQALGCGTELPRHITWLPMSPLDWRSRSRIAKRYHW